MALLEEFNFRWPNFKTPPVTEPPTPAATDEQIQYWLDWAENYLCPNQWGLNYREAVLLLAAVMLSSQIRAQQDGAIGTGVMGPVASASVGGESVSYGTRGRTNVRFSDEWFLGYPPYGPEYLFLRDSTILGAAATRTGFCGDMLGKSC